MEIFMVVEQHGSTFITNNAQGGIGWNGLSIFSSYFIAVRKYTTGRQTKNRKRAEYSAQESGRSSFATGARAENADT